METKSSDPYEDYSYVVTNEPSPEGEKETATKNAISGIFSEIERAEQEAQGVHNNHKIAYCGMICPVIRETDSHVWILHGHSEICIPRDRASKTLGARDKEKKPGWTSVYQNPLMTAHRS